MRVYLRASIPGDSWGLPSSPSLQSSPSAQPLAIQSSEIPVLHSAACAAPLPGLVVLVEETVEVVLELVRRWEVVDLPSGAGLDHFLENFCTNMNWQVMNFISVSVPGICGAATCGA